MTVKFCITFLLMTAHERPCHGILTERVKLTSALFFLMSRSLKHAIVRVHNKSMPIQGLYNKNKTGKQDCTGDRSLSGSGLGDKEMSFTDWHCNPLPSPVPGLLCHAGEGMRDILIPC